MKTPLQLLLLSLAALASASAAPVLLTSGPDRAADGKYLYFSTNQPFLSQAYYPGLPTTLVTTQGYLDGARAGAAIAAGDVADSWISFASGDLTDGLTTNAGSVSGWQTRLSGSGTTRPGPYVLFDLGAVYSISDVNVILQSSSQYRWNSTANIQEIWTASSLSAAPGTGVTLDNSTTFWTKGIAFTAVNDGATNVTLGINQNARYVLLLLTASTVDSNNAGGIIREINIYGELANVPEPSSSATLAGCVAIGVLACSRSRYHRSR